MSKRLQHGILWKTMPRPPNAAGWSVVKTIYQDDSDELTGEGIVSGPFWGHGERAPLGTKKACIDNHYL